MYKNGRKRKKRTKTYKNGQKQIKTDKNGRKWITDRIYGSIYCNVLHLFLRPTYICIVVSNCKFVYKPIYGLLFMCNT